MKSWRPRNPPSNRDRLELYALHKQSISGDAPPQQSSSSESSVADKAKLNAWNGKRGMTKVDAMVKYIQECDRQLRVYGTRDDTNSTASASSTSSPPRSPMQHPAASTAESSSSSVHNRQATTSSPTTPQNTPARENTQSDNEQGNNANDGGVLLCPRGLAAIPLLCAAASESRSAYLARLQVTHPSNGWWAKQEPLCLEVNNPLSIPERATIALAAAIEQLSLMLGQYGAGNNNNVNNNTVSIILSFLMMAASGSPRVLQAFLWPVHNVLLCCWITLILTTTYLGSMVMMSQTLLFGAKRTNAPLGRLFMEEVHPAARAVESLCEQHQVIGVRVSGLALMPLMMMCDLAMSVMGRVGILVGSLVFVAMGVFSWWYWLCVLPWLAVCGLCLAVMSGWCFGLIELAGQ